MRRVILSALIIFGFSFEVYAYKLSWDISKDERIEMVKTADVRYYINAELKKTYEERNVIDLSCSGKSDMLNRVDGVFTVLQRDSGEKVFHVMNQYAVDFLIEPSGKFIVKHEAIMPNLRNIPSFPDKDVNVNDTWSAEGLLILDNFSRPFALKFPVEYTLVGVIKDNGKDIAIINYYYSINMNMGGEGYPKDFPIKIVGENKGILHWDTAGNKPKEIKDAYQIAFIFANAGSRDLTSIEFHMNIKTENNLYKNYTPKEKETARDELQKELPAGVVADIDKRGLVFRMDDILFDFDSSELKSDTVEKLNKIAEIIKKRYSDREIIVEGHTDSVGNSVYNFGLSEKRAKRVSEYLGSNSSHDKFSYRGFGKNNPIADNSTPEGRQKNRRVEIIIKTN
ncbi:MAG: OmpA family protein [Leptospirales bacterium]|nr:OmpA family protein [Leptospirales bacterium]